MNVPWNVCYRWCAYVGQQKHASERAPLILVQGHIHPEAENKEGKEGLAGEEKKGGEQEDEDRNE